MNKASLVIPYHLKNSLFDIENKDVNRDNNAYSYYLLKILFESKGFDLSTFDINTVEEAKVVIYFDMPKKIPEKINIHKSYLIILESKIIKPDNWDFEKHAYFNKIFTWDDTLVDNKKYFKINYSHLFPHKINNDLLQKTKLCTLIAGNKKVSHPLELYSERIIAIKWFEKFHLQDFDFYGVGWDNLVLKNKYLNFIFKKAKLSNLFTPHYSSYGGKVESKRDILKNYKFSICYENARDIPGYITEKIFDSFFASCVPIYLGANNISDHIPEECFIDKRKFESYEDLYYFIKNMSDLEYKSYLINIELYLKSKKSKSFSANHFAETIVSNIVKNIEN